MISQSTLWAIACSSAVIGWMLYLIIKSGNDHKTFTTQGVKVKAKILRRTCIGASSTGNTKLKLVVEYPTHEGTKTATAKRYFTPEEIVCIHDGTVTLYYLPDKPERICLHPGNWEE